MKIFAETERLILREILPSDDQGMFELDSDEEVHKYLGGKPISTIEQARETINLIRQQYKENGIGRWAVIEKETGNFIGWAGLKLEKGPRNDHNNYYDLGYRFIRKYWSKGYATEAAKCSLEYGFEKLGLKTIYAMTDVNNSASRKVLEKVGLKYVNTFDYIGITHHWFKIEKPIGE